VIDLAFNYGPKETHLHPSSEGALSTCEREIQDRVKEQVTGINGRIGCAAGISEAA
jgi:hypothetical protein